MDSQKAVGRPLWTERPREEEAGIQYRVVRCSPNGVKGWVIISEKITGARTHYARDRTRPCEGEGCKSCEEGNSSRWYGWFFIWHPVTDQRVIFEITAAAAGGVDEYEKKYGTLRGATFEAFRKPKRLNGRLYVQCWKTPGDWPKMPMAPQIEPILLNMWGIKEIGFEDQKISAAVGWMEEQIRKKRK